MAREFSRTDRVAHEIQKELALIIQREVKDPRLGMVTISDVEVSRDLAHAKIFVSFFEDNPDKIKGYLKVLNDAAGFMRTLLARRIRIRTMPALRFLYDSTLVEAMRLSKLVDEAVARDKARRKDEED